MPADEPSYPSVWTRPRRQERSTLTRSQIVTEALRLLDDEGADSLSMRKLAARLGSGATSIYWHVANRDELLELVIDEVYGEIDVPAPDEQVDWQTATRRFARSTRSTILRHRWATTMLDRLQSPSMGPNEMQLVDRLIGVLVRSGFDLMEAEHAISTVGSYVLGASTSEAAWLVWLDRTGRTPEEWVAESESMAGADTQEYPHLRALFEVYDASDPQAMSEQTFEYGLDVILDGLATRIG